MVSKVPSSKSSKLFFLDFSAGDLPLELQIGLFDLLERECDGFPRLSFERNRTFRETG
jgi:hypothetical protein